MNLSNNDPSAPDRGKTGEFVGLFTRHSRRIFSYILTLVPNHADAEEVFQETSLTLWDKYGEYEQGTHFGAWACRIAYFKTLNFRSRQKHGPLTFSDKFVALVDNVRSTPGAVRMFVGRRHHATIVEDFDDHDSFDRWHGDKTSFQLGRSGASGHTQGHVNHRPNADGSLSVGSGYLSSKSASKGNLSRGHLSSPSFVLDGDILEFYLAGTGDRVAFQLVAVEADGAESVIASATTRSAAFTCRYWPIHPGWVGRTVCVRLVDDAADGYIEVDAVRVVRFNVPGES